MTYKINFILNDEEKTSTLPLGNNLLDYIRDVIKITGTKEGCREGDCGACTVLLGELIDDEVHYKSINSCLYPIGKIDGKHVVTIEGLNLNSLSPIQESYVSENASQCGFCTPGFIVSTTGFLLENVNYELSEIKDSIAGNICRCTGYISILRALENIKRIDQRVKDSARLESLIDSGYIPSYFLTIVDRLKKLPDSNYEINKNSVKIVGGGTDLYVQSEDDLKGTDPFLVFNNPAEHIWIDDNYVFVDGCTTFEEFANSNIIQTLIPSFNKFNKLIASLPIRNSATLAGNIVNASPIGDLTIVLLALDAILLLEKDNLFRELPLKKFFLDYKNIDKSEFELVKAIKFSTLDNESFFNFEKVSKRTNLDIASVNSAIKIEVIDENINACCLSFGGIAPIPKYMNETVHFLTNQKLNIEIIKETIKIIDEEISPISDVRGSAEYKRLLAKQMFKTHIVELFPNKFSVDQLK